MTQGALSGIRVIEYCTMVTGPYCAKMLASVGAEVIKVESPGGDPARQRGDFPGGKPNSEKSALFLNLNTNKLGITLNLKDKRGKEVFKKLIEDADVLIEDSVPSQSRSLGLSYTALSAINPRLVMVSITPFGRTGPYKNYRAYNLNTFASGGEANFLPGGVLDREPIKGAGFLNDYDNAVCSAVGAMAALYSARVTGKGQHVDVSKQEAAFALTKIDVARYKYDGMLESRKTRGPRPGAGIRCKDGYVQVHCPGDHQWDAMKAAMGRPTWADDPKFKTRPDRIKYVSEINRRIEDWAKDLTAEEAAAKVQAAGAPAAPYKTVGQLMNDEHLKFRGFLKEIEHSVAGKLIYPQVAYTLSDPPAGYDRPAPLLGQHNELVLAKLGYSKAEIKELAKAGII